MTVAENGLIELPRRQWLRPSEVASFLALSERHVRRLCEQGTLCAFRMGPDQRSVLRVSRDSVLNFVREAVAEYRYQNGILLDGTDNTDT